MGTSRATNGKYWKGKRNEGLIGNDWGSDSALDF